MPIILADPTKIIKITQQRRDVTTTVDDVRKTATPVKSEASPVLQQLFMARRVEESPVVREVVRKEEPPPPVMASSTRIMSEHSSRYTKRSAYLDDMLTLQD